METVERLCDRVALINRGEKLLDGAVAEVKASYGKNTLVLAFDGDGSFLGRLPGVAKVSDFGRYVEMQLATGADPQAILQRPRRGCGCAASRSSSRACTTSSSRRVTEPRQGAA